jgi:hypothetical protein
MATIIHWLNDEPEAIRLQRDNTFAMLTWRDFNQPQPPMFTMQMAVWLFLITAGLPLLMLS